MSAESIKKYYGFAKKSGAVVFGADKICEAKKIYLLFASGDLKENSLKKLVRKSERADAPLCVLEAAEFKQIEPNASIKCVGIKNSELAKAMQRE